MVKKALEIFKHYRSVYPQVHHYTGIMAVYGLVNLAEVTGRGSEEYSLCREVLAAFPDGIDHPPYNFPSYAIGGIAKARAVYSGISPEEEQVRVYAQELMTAARNAEGLIGHPAPGQAEKVWIDAMFAVVPFLLFAGLHFHESKYLDEAVFQALGMYDLFRSPENGLLRQSINFCGPGVISPGYWSRGNGWGVFPLADLCQWLPDEHPERPRCEAYFRAHLEALAGYQSESGLWRQEITRIRLDELESYEETSGSGLILYAMGVGLCRGLLDGTVWRPRFERGIRGLLGYGVNADNAIEHSCPGCLSPGDGSARAYLSHKKPYRDEPHGAGPVIMALAQAVRNGITELE